MITTAKNPALPLVKAVKETSDMETVAQMLNSGDWIAINATKSENGYLFVLGKVN